MTALTPKQEAFCLKYVECGVAVDAYRHAYNAGKMKDGTIRVRASELLHKPNVAARIQELQAQLAERHAVTVDDIAKQLDEDRKLAHKACQPGAAVSATMGKAKLFGLLTEKHDHNVTINADAARQVVASLFAKHAAKLVKK